MILVSIRLITEDVGRLAGFYGTVTGLPPTVYTPDFAEIVAPGCTLAIGSTRTLQLFGLDAAGAVGVRRAIVEFRVDDVDAEFRRLEPEIEGAVVQPPTTMPWGNRSLLFRDPDRNLVNLFTPLTPEAIARARR